MENKDWPQSEERCVEEFTYSQVLFPYTKINPNKKIDDIILIGLRDFQDEKCDVIWKYYPEEAKTLKAMGEIPEHTVIDESKQKEDVIFYNTK